MDGGILRIGRWRWRGQQNEGLVAYAESDNATIIDGKEVQIPTEEHAWVSLRNDAHRRLLGGGPPVRRLVEDVDLAAGRTAVVAIAE
jgi:hypothetical protein